jgi:hypothetical protein
MTTKTTSITRTKTTASSSSSRELRAKLTSSRQSRKNNNKDHAHPTSSETFPNEDSGNPQNDQPTIWTSTRSDHDGSSSQRDGAIITTIAVTTTVSTTTVDEAIERLGMGYFQLVVLTAAGLCFAADAMQVLQLSFLSQVLRIEWHLSDEDAAFITSILFVGAIFGTLTLGPLADKKGRKPVFLLAASIISCFGTVAAMVTDYWSLLASLFMVGWGVGGLTGESVFHAKHGNHYGRLLTWEGIDCGT